MMRKETKEKTRTLNQTMTPGKNITHLLLPDFTDSPKDCHSDFLRATACNASHVLAIVQASVCQSVRPSHSAIVSERRNLGS